MPSVCNGRCNTQSPLFWTRGPVSVVSTQDTSASSTPNITLMTIRPLGRAARGQCCECRSRGHVCVSRLRVVVWVCVRLCVRVRLRVVAEVRSVSWWPWWWWWGGTGEDLWFAKGNRFEINNVLFFYIFFFIFVFIIFLFVIYIHYFYSFISLRQWSLPRDEPFASWMRGRRERPSKRHVGLERKVKRHVIHILWSSTMKIRKYY